jgi:hypothetical protein
MVFGGPLSRPSCPKCSVKPSDEQGVEVEPISPLCPIAGFTERRSRVNSERKSILAVVLG